MPSTQLKAVYVNKKHVQLTAILTNDLTEELSSATGSYAHLNMVFPSVVEANIKPHKICFICGAVNFLGHPYS